MVKHEYCNNKTETYEDWIKSDSKDRNTVLHNVHCFNICNAGHKIIKGNTTKSPPCIECTDKEKKDKNNKQCYIDPKNKFKLTKSGFLAQRDGNPRRDFYSGPQWGTKETEKLWCKYQKINPLTSAQLIQGYGELDPQEPWNEKKRKIPKQFKGSIDKWREAINKDRGSKQSCTRALCTNGGNRPSWACEGGATKFLPKDIIQEEVWDWQNDMLTKKKVKKDPYKDIDWFLFKGLRRNLNYESCMNEKLDTGDENESEIIKRIKEYENILEWKETDIDYIEKKLKKIISLDESDLTHCIQILHLKTNICRSGMSEKLFHIVNLINSILNISLDTANIQENTREHDRLLHMIDRLGPYIPKVFEKIIKISKYYEMKKCHHVSANTQLLEKLYHEMLVKPLNRKINWGINLDFDYFHKLTPVEFVKTIILLVVIIYAISKGMELVIALTSRGGTSK